MKTRNYHLKLSTGSVDRLIRNLEKYKADMLKKVDELIDVMCENGETFAIRYLSHIDTGLTLGSIMSYRDGNRGIIQVGGHAIWIEFGTGTTYNKGEDGVHDNKYELGLSPWGQYGKGQGNADLHPNGWAYQTDDGSWRMTKGIPMNPFMAQTAMELERYFRTEVKKVWK
jgi:hypothetical protein